MREHAGKHLFRAATLPRTLDRSAPSLIAALSPGLPVGYEYTCSKRRLTLIERYGYLIEPYRLTGKGRCPDCSTRIPGLWSAAAKYKPATGLHVIFRARCGRHRCICKTNRFGY
ncbi:hypothetical protein ACXR0O_06650 [Verrucomicrobiota bacterium sgz303538]